MWRRWPVSQFERRLFYSTKQTHKPTRIIDINHATCYRQHPTPDDTPESNPALFPSLSFRLLKDTVDNGQNSGHIEHWAILSPSSLARTTLLQILAGQHICIPPTARSYPYLSYISKSPQQAIRYVGFDAERGSNVGGSSVRGAYLSARYESRREETDYSLMDYLTGHTELNALEHEMSEMEREVLDEAIQKLNLQALLTMPVANLSNGQTRRARIAKALMARPEVLLLDGPYMGLDPNTLSKLDAVLHDLAERQAPRLILSLRPEDGVPEWITHLIITDESLRILEQNRKADLYSALRRKESGRPKTPPPPSSHILRAAADAHHSRTTTALSKDAFPKHSPSPPPGSPLVEMTGVKVSYGPKTVLGDWTHPSAPSPGLHWSLHRGQRAGIFGPNGSGKTTMLSLITSDHPQTYSLPIKLFGRSRNEPGVSLFDLQRRIGHSSPEIHAFFPRNLSVRRALESAWADAPLAKPSLTADADNRVDAVLRWFAEDLNPMPSSSREQPILQILENIATDPIIHTPSARLAAAEKYFTETFHASDDILWAENTTFRSLPFSSQRLLLFLRAIVHSPDLVILDEAFSGMDERVRDKALLFLSHGEKITSVVDGRATESVLSTLGKVTFSGLEERQALLVISHSKEDVPGCVRDWICLPEPGEGRQPRLGTLEGPLELNREGWGQIWGKA